MNYSEERMKRIIENLQSNELGLDDEFKFNCKRCGKCCINREDIMLSPKDIYRLCKKLRLSPKELIYQYCDAYIGPTSMIPLVRLRPLGSIKRCPFLKQRKCSVHESKPVVCALFPLGRGREIRKGAEKDDVKIRYFLQPTECNDLTKTFTVREWLKEFDLSEDGDYFVKWSNVTLKAANLVKERCDHPDENYTAFVHVFAGYMYMNYNIDEDFDSQFEENISRAFSLIDDIFAISDEISKIKDITEKGSKNGSGT